MYFYIYKLFVNYLYDLCLSQSDIWIYGVHDFYTISFSFFFYRSIIPRLPFSSFLFLLLLFVYTTIAIFFLYSLTVSTYCVHGTVIFFSFYLISTRVTCTIVILFLHLVMYIYSQSVDSALSREKW